MSLLLLQKRRAMMKQFAWNTMTGTGSLTLLNGLKASFKELKLIGNSVQGYTVKVLSGELEQGTMSIVDGMNVTSNYRVRTKGFLDIEKGKYKVTCEGAKQGNVIFYDKNGTFQKALFDVHTVFPFVLTVEEACKIKVVVSNGTEAEQIAITPNNVKSIAVATEISPEYRQEVKSVGRKSRNLFDISKFPLEHDEEAIIIKPTDVTAKLIDGNELEENTRYTVWFESYENTQTENIDAPLIEIVYTDGTKSEIYVHRNFYIKTDASKNVSYIWFRNPWKGGCKLSRLQIEKGNSITQYGPYGMYLLDVQVSGRNLVDIDALKNENGYMSGAYEKSRDIDHFNIVKGKRYLLITKGKPLVAGDYSSVYFGDETLKYGVNHYDVLGTATGYTSFTSDLKQNRAILTAKKTATITKMILHGRVNTRKDDYDVEEFGLFEILEDNTNIDYEQYKEPQTTQIPLDEPLRGIGEYKDVITKDGILRKIKEIVFDGDEVWKKHFTQNKEKTQAFGIAISDISNKQLNVMSDKFIYIKDGFITDEPCIASYGGTDIWVNIEKTKASTVEEFKVWLSENPVTVQYVLKEPTTEPLQTELGNLHTYNGTTCIYTDSGEVQTGIEATYKSNRREKNE